MTYTDCLMRQARSAWDTWYGVSDRACRYTSQVWEWYIDTFFSAKSDKAYRDLGNTLGFAMVCAVALGQTARVYWDAAMSSDEAQELAEVAADAVEVAKPYAERHAWHAINTVARPVLNHLGQYQELEAELGEDDFRLEALADHTDWLEHEPVPDAFNAEVARFQEQFEGKEIPELLLIADQLQVPVPTIQCSKSQLVSLIREAL